MLQEYAIKIKKNTNCWLENTKEARKGILEGKGKSKWQDKASKREKKNRKFKKNKIFSPYIIKTEL